MTFSASRLAALPEWQLIEAHLRELRSELLEDLLRCDGIEKVKYIQGQVFCVEYLLSLPERLFKGDVQNVQN